MATSSHATPGAPRRSPRANALVLAGSLVLAIGLAVGYVYVVEPLRLPRTDPFAGQGIAGVPAMLPGLRQPPAVSAAKAGLAEDEEVIGVCAAGRCRAYPVRGMSVQTTHVINDLLGDVPVSVAYCDVTDCARVYSSSERGAALDLSLGGWLQGQMLLRAGTGFYLHQSGQPSGHTSAAFPYADYPFERTSWKAWKAAHPDTEVVIPQDTPGGLPAGGASGQATVKER